MLLSFHLFVVCLCFYWHPLKNNNHKASCQSYSLVALWSWRWRSSSIWKLSQTLRSLLSTLLCPHAVPCHLTHVYTHQPERDTKCDFFHTHIELIPTCVCFFFHIQLVLTIPIDGRESREGDDKIKKERENWASAHAKVGAASQWHVFWQS